MLKFKRFIAEDKTEEEQDQIDEVISLKTRIKKKITARARQGRMKMGRKIWRGRKAGTKRIGDRSQKQARRDMKKKFSRGKKWSSMSAAQKQSVERQADRRKGLTKKLATRLRPVKRRADLGR